MSNDREALHNLARQMRALDPALPGLPPALPEGLATVLGIRDATGSARWYGAEASAAGDTAAPEPPVAALPVAAKRGAEAEAAEPPPVRPAVAGPAAAPSPPPAPAVPPARPLPPPVNEHTMSRGQLLSTIERLARWGNAESDLAAHVAAAHSRFPGCAPEVEARVREGRAQGAALAELRGIIRQHGPGATVAQDCADAIHQRWPRLEPAIHSLFDFEIGNRAKLAAGATSRVVARGDHRLASLPEAESYVVLVDETGERFSAQGPGVEGRFVAVVVPGSRSLPPLDLHASSALPDELDAALQVLLDAPVGVLGVRLEDLPRLSGDRWIDGVIELLHWTVRLLPLHDGGAPVRVSVVVEQRGRQAVHGDRWTEAARAVTRALAATDPARAARVNLEVEVHDKSHPHLAYADVVAHTWAGRTQNGKARRRQSGLLRSCLPEGDTAAVRDAWDTFTTHGGLPVADWQALLAHPDAADEHSLAGVLLARVGARCSPTRWTDYLEAVTAHLEGKRIDLARLGREIDWLAEWLPEGAALPPAVRLAWDTARLARGNHLGAIDLELVGQLDAVAAGLLDEDASLVCQCDLHRAVAHTNRFEFAQATLALARWIDQPPRVPGLQLWGRVRSSLGQHRAFAGDFAGARALFSDAIAAFSRLSDTHSAALDVAQTGTYYAIAAMDDPAVDDAEAQAAVERVTGPLSAAGALAASAAPADRYRHHLLLRYLFTRGASAAAYLEARPRWATGAGHPWPLIHLYRGLLLGGDEAVPEFTRGVELAWAEDQGPTVRLIGCVVAAIAVRRGATVDGLDDEINGVRRALGAAMHRLAALERWRADRLPERWLLDNVLPFNFR